MRSQLPKAARLCFLLWFLSLGIMAAPATSQAKISLSFMPIEEAKFLVKGDGWENAASVEVTINYDVNYLAAPEATIMGGILQGRSDLSDTPGQLHFTAINDGRSPNFEVCVFFQKQGPHPAVIYFVTAEVIGPAGIYPVPVEIKPNPNIPRMDDAEPDGMGPAEQSWSTD